MPPRDDVINEAVNLFGTPFYLLSEHDLRTSVQAIRTKTDDLVSRHFFSMKTQPVPHVLRYLLDNDFGLEVVSTNEVHMALELGCKADRLVINGTRKHQWLDATLRGPLCVNLDSLSELEFVVRTASDNGWRIGLRIRVDGEYDPDDTAFMGQFGLIPSEVSQCGQALAQAGMSVDTVHFHIGSAVSDAERYRRAINSAIQAARTLPVLPRIFNLGGGLPCVPDSAGEAASFDWHAFRATLESLREATGAEIWMENGRAVSSASGVLVVRVDDIKLRPDARYLLCDGGRTNHALVSDWEHHSYRFIPSRPCTNMVRTCVAGPTCMHFDWLARGQMSDTIRVGDLFVWEDAGAYHIPWETRFSSGLIPVVWYSLDGTLSLARPREEVESVVGQWVIPS